RMWTIWVATIVPDTDPKTVMSRATMSPTTVAFGATVTARPSLQIGPSTEPSIVTSSVVCSSPRTKIEGPITTMHADCRTLVAFSTQRLSTCTQHPAPSTYHRTQHQAPGTQHPFY